MKSIKNLTFVIVTLGMMTAACSKKTENNTDDKIQKIVDQTNTDNQKQIEKIKSDFEEIQNKTNQIVDDAENQTDQALDAVKKTTLNYVNKMVRVDILNSKDQVQKSYLDFFEMDATSGSYKSRFETLLFMDGAGLCINLASLDCETSFNIQTLAQRMGTLSAGRLKMTDSNSAQLSKIPDMIFKSSSKVLKLERDYMIVELKANSALITDPKTIEASAKKIKISTLGKLSQTKHNFFQLTEDKSNRKDVSEVDSDLKKLSVSTVRVLISGEGGSMLHGGGSGHGTGFFISDDGLMLTNNHVADGLTDCINFHKCSVELVQIDSNNKVSTYKVNAKLLITDISMDFALLKITLPDEMKIQKLEIEDQEVDSELMTLGYPGDRASDRTNVPLSYSFGKLVGTFDLGYTTSVYIAGGASGSAMLNLKNRKVVAILSNGNQPVPGEDGSPGIARPIQMINAKYGIDDYLNGTKETRVTKILQVLKVSSSTLEASQALEAFEQEQTFLGLGVMKSIMLSHQDITIRKLIMNYLEKKGIVMGPDEL